MVTPVQDSTKIIKHTDGEYYLDVGDTTDGTWDNNDVKVTADIKEMLFELTSSGALNGSAWTFDEIVGSIDRLNQGVDSTREGSWAELTKRLESVMKSLEKAQQELTRLETVGRPEDATLIKQMKKLVTSLTKEAQELYKALGTNIENNPNPTHQAKLGTLYTKLTQLKVTVDEPKTGEGGKTTTTPDTNTHQSRTGARAATQPMAFGGGAKAGGWSAMNTASSGATGFAGYSMDAYLQSVWSDKASLEGYEDALKQRSEQKQMMMLFFYFVKMAMSGDLGAMYRFMQFITYIISKDKAMMNIYMAHMLIENENAQREALEEWIGKGTPDSNDSNSVYEWQAGLQKLNSIQSSLGMSQKLIANMMEEMAQIVEALMGMTKSALDANGRVLQRLTRG